MSNVDHFSVAILAGGQSQRMGEDKALIRLAPDQPTLLEMAIEVTKPLTDDQFIVGFSRPGEKIESVRLVEDHFPGSGPLGGIATALLSARFDRCLIIGCDQPFLSRAVLMQICQPPFAGLVAPITDDPSRQGHSTVQFLHAIYSLIELPVIQRRITDRQLKLANLLPSVNSRLISAEELQLTDDKPPSWHSVDTPEQLKAARQYLVTGRWVDSQVN